MYRGRRDYAATVTAQVDPGFNVGPVVYHPAWMLEIHMASAAASYRLNCLWQRAMFALKFSQTLVPAVSRVYI